MKNDEIADKLDELIERTMENENLFERLSKLADKIDDNTSGYSSTMEWKEPSIEATEHKYIIALVDVKDEDGELNRNLLLLDFDGIRNKWNTVGCGWSGVKLNNIIY